MSLEERRCGWGLVLVHAVIAGIPAASALATGWLVASLTAMASGRGAAATLVWPVMTMSILLIADEVLGLASAALEQYTAGRIDARVRRRVRALALSPDDMAHLEDSAFADEAARASDIGEGRFRSPGTASVGQLRLLFRILAALGSAGVIAVSFTPALSVVLLGASLIMRAALRRWWLQIAEVRDSREGLRRRVEYWTDIASTGAAAKEVRLFGLHQWVVHLRTREELAWAGPLWSIDRDVLRRQWFIALLAAISAGSALLWPGLAAARGDLPVEELMTVLVAAWALFEMGGMGREAFDIEYGLGAVRALNRLNSSHENTRALTAGRSRSDGPAALHAEGLVFRYPGASQNVIDGLDLHVRPGEVLALVGHNGVGKTTLVKVLAGLYVPTAGQLLVDGSPLQSSDLAAWRRRAAVVFQDFNRYPLSVADNIALAAPEHRDDLDGIRAAARQVGIDGFIDQLPDGYRTPLSSDLNGGTDLSGGQWQRIAIARAIFAVEHGRDLLILDEPTAHLDVEAEAGFYRRIIAEVTGATVLLISHRLSTVRPADRIVLLDKGRVAEQGSHETLIANGQAYARDFHLQAARFRNTEAER
ncbi:ABC transporter ATP-binding protein [Nonomuraea sp. NPDC049400]|uniref:ABC transporter ATP-binding protein n=1 Tax=Nonomuraea sp. NPDC049400 TaxID=3364352 RepID=UPI00379A5117